jgi:hypothetical protein
MQLVDDDYDSDLDNLINAFEKSQSPRRRIEDYHEARRLRNDLRDFDSPGPRRKRRRKR